MTYAYGDISILNGKTLSNIEVVRGDYNQDDHIDFITTENETYRLYHPQDCCESVTINDIIGDVNNLVGSPILIAREDTNVPPSPVDDGYSESFTWTFYNLATIKGYVTIRWYGESNGYYSESVYFAKIS